jgi:bla regulator protein blaR1
MIGAMHEFLLSVGGSLPAAIVTKATVVTTFGLIGVRLARRQRAAVRHVLLAATFGVLLLLPVASIVVPPVRIAVPDVRQDRATLPPTAGPIDLTPPLILGDKHSAAAPASWRSSKPSLPEVTFIGWFAGVALALVPLLVGLGKIRRLLRSGLPWAAGQATLDRLALETGIRVRVDVLQHEALPGPIASGMLHPAILLPPDAETWAKDDLNRALVHELEHVRRGDVMIHCLARAVCAVYWFHPLVWLAWRQLTLEAERACDDAVIARSEATAYADQLVALARKLLASEKSPLLAMASRSDLVIRVKAVLDSHQPRGRAGTLAVALGCAVAAALVLTISPLRTVSAPQSYSAQSKTDSPSLPSFEVASVKPNSSGDLRHYFSLRPGRFGATGMTIKFLMTFAYNVKEFQIVGGPDWVNSERYDIEAKEEDSVAAKSQKLPFAQYREQVGLMVQSLLTDRFKLRVAHNTKQLPVYALVVANKGPRLIASEVSTSGLKWPTITGGRGELTATRISLGGFADALTGIPDLGGRKVLDETGLKGEYDINLQWAPDQSQPVPTGAAIVPGNPPPLDASGPSIFTAIQEQLGLKLKSTKGPVDVIVIDHIERPSEN